MEPAMGFEPATACLQNRCSTIELRRPEKLQRTLIYKLEKNGERSPPLSVDYVKAGGSPGTRTPNQLMKSQLLYH